MIYCKPILFTDENGYTGKAPVYKTKEAACADMALPKAINLNPGEVVRVDLLVGFDIPNGKKLVMYPRSSLLFKYGIMSPTSIIDSDYSGQHIHFIAINLGKEPVVLDKDTRVVQIECVPCEQVADWERENTERTGGFGSTGK
ncbi:MAG: deoxyuridine 5'-triphosphate nucleotidohydrolase [Clostridia bacterium]|nr:deoxyuridine 5'-triphosphate nucleotidohydrolase [Clostridia bacterium]